ncbi:MAG TPA: hypothetical protein VGO85_02390 [Caldimonas sp.]|jgi:hypothetical protein|nr:hypothetical protein [Caldimonas sp.]
MTSPWIDRNRRAFGVAAVAGLALAAAACTSMGTGTGSVTPGNAPVTFDWTSKDGGNTGTMSATIDNGASFSGPFLQITSNVQTDALEPMWGGGWRRGWNDWGYWGSFPDTEFSTRYSGKVVANLKGPGSQQLRCRFHLNSPAAGMGGGGQGECQFTGGRTVDAVFQRA